jgi:hypothetical protein
MDVEFQGRKGRIRRGEDGQDYIVIGNMAIGPITWKEVNGKKIPEIKVKAREVPNAQGGTDVIVEPPCLKIDGNIPMSDD